MKPIWAVVPVILMSAWGGGRVAVAEGFVKAEGTSLMLDGKEYRAIGVNIPHLSQAYMGTWFHIRDVYKTPENARHAMVEAIQDAAGSKIAFVRFFAAPGYPVDIDKLYAVDRDEYWRLMDEVFELCRKHNVKLVPSLGIIGTWSTYLGEPRQALLDPDSETHKATYGYVREFVSRYKDDPTVLMWELSNEVFHFADLNFTGKRARGRGVFSPDSTAYREKLSFEDSLSTAMLMAVCESMTTFIKDIDSNHLVTTGDAGPRACSVSLRENFPKTVWKIDTLRQHFSSLLMQQAAPLDVISLHKYGNFTSKTKVAQLDHLEFLRCAVRCVHSSLCPVFVGELGQAKPHFKDDPQAEWTRAAIDLLEEEGAALAAIWVWHFPWQDDTFNIPSSAAHPALMERIAAFNTKWAGLR